MAGLKIPSSFRRYIVKELGTKFRDIVDLVTVPMLKPGPKDLLIRTRFMGINASDINFSAGRYDPSKKPPFEAGFEGVGEVVATGSACKFVSVGQSVAYMMNGAFSEYMLVREKQAFPVPTAKAEYVPLLVSGLTAAISLDKIGEIKKGETVLVTAAAGGTGQFAVQIAKNHGCHVIGTCSSDDKVEFLKSIGCDRPVNYKKESLNEVLKTEYPRGLDVVYESIGGDMFDICVNRLAQHGRLIVIGYISGYEKERGYVPSRTLSTLPARILSKSASIRGFFLFGFVHEIREYLPKLVHMLHNGEIKVFIDKGENSPKGPFIGIEKVYDAVEHLYTQRSIGKIMVELPEDPTSKL